MTYPLWWSLTTKCPKHPEATLIKTMEGAKKISGVWFPAYICPVDNEFYTFVQIHGEDAVKREIEKMEYIAVISPYFMTREELKGIFSEIATDIVERVISELRRRGVV